MRRIAQIGILGAGAWGTALAMAGARAGLNALLVGRDPTQAALMASSRLATKLPSARLPASVTPSSCLTALKEADALLLAVPAQAMREVCASLTPVVRPEMPVVACAKGIERGTGRFMTEIVGELLPETLPAILSGPSFAVDVAAGLPTAVVVAMDDAIAAAALATALTSPTLRLYHTTDRRGVEIGGAAKNVLAIAAGVVEGRGLGDSARAALTARGFAELRRFAAAHGAKPETLMGLSGLGDLMLTTSTPKSRNFAYGLALGRGDPPALAAHGKLAEGAFTAGVLADMARRCGIAMPVCEAVAAIIDGRLSINAAIDALMNRPVKAEE